MNELTGRLTNPKHGNVRSIRFPHYESDALKWAAKLAEYEDTGYTPAQVAEITEKIRDGRLAEVVRCKDCRFSWRNGYVDNGELSDHAPCVKGWNPDANDHCSYGKREEG